MCETYISKRYKEDVRVFIPTTHIDVEGEDREIHIEEKIADSEEKIPKNYPGVTISRWVINFHVFWIDNQGQRHTITNLRRYPMEIRVGHRPGDGNNLYWLHPHKRTLIPIGVFTPANHPDPDYDGYCYATIREFEDPNIGWG